MSTQVYNVSQVPHYSPLRYPGGKSWLIPYIRRWLESIPRSQRREFYEPFCGGASVGLAVAGERLADHVTLVELDPDVAALWDVLINDPDGAPDLARIVASLDLTPELITAIAASPPASLTQQQRALRVLVLNRTGYNGRLDPGKGGQTSDHTCRWYGGTFYRRLMAIGAIRHRLSFIQGNGLALLRLHNFNGQAATYIDPPYTAAAGSPGRRLYTYNVLDHASLFALASDLAHPVLMSYDDMPEVRALATRYGFAVASVPMRSGKNKIKQELLISRDLNWLE